MSEGPPATKKIRSCSSSESTNPVSDEASASSLLEAAKKYQAEARRRHQESLTEASSAKEDVLAAMEILKRAHERLSRVEAVAEEASKSLEAATEYVAKWERQLSNGKKSSSENEEEQKHVSFAPLHPVEVTSMSAPTETRRARRKRIRASEFGWGIYEGLLDSLGEPHGRGTITWENGGKYEGDWADGKANGYGVMLYGNGDRYEGQWKDGNRFGQGTHHFKDGGVYEGEWRNAAPDGQGKMTLKNGSHYEGKWKDGKWHGLGIVRPVNGGEWEGQFEFGKCTVGTLRRPNGELEIGLYNSVNPDDVKEGVWWSIDRKAVWSIEKGKKKQLIDLQKASEIAAKIGVSLPIKASPPEK